MDNKLAEELRNKNPEVRLDCVLACLVGDLHLGSGGNLKLEGCFIFVLQSRPSRLYTPDYWCDLFTYLDGELKIHRGVALDQLHTELNHILAANHGAVTHAAIPDYINLVPVTA